MDELDVVSLQDLEPAYKEPEITVQSVVSFNVDYYKSHYVPVREVIELRKAIHE
ncbi:hypothetical protein SAMN04487902_101336 [Prevotella sp. ne3005]|nr:hypothetical protein SAMN04487902_101336 [Prevotella sp. ne3005]